MKGLRTTFYLGAWTAAAAELAGVYTADHFGNQFSNAPFYVTLGTLFIASGQLLRQGIAMRRARLSPPVARPGG